ncbi:TPA: sugar transferase, partial [Enterococcus faecium]
MSGKILYKNIIKRILDLVISVLLISILFPVLIIISILIKATSNGPIFFKQKRIGKNGCTFHIYKFR